MGVFDWLFGDTDDEEAQLDDMILMDMDDEGEWFYMNEDFDKVKKVIEAANDVAKINEAIRSEYNLQQKANSVYRSVYYKNDYAKFIAVEKIRQNMCGTSPFEKLRIEDKKAVLEMIREAIKNYVLSIVWLSASLLTHTYKS